MALQRISAWTWEFASGFTSRRVTMWEASLAVKSNRRFRKRNVANNRRSSTCVAIHERLESRRLLAVDLQVEFDAPPESVSPAATVTYVARVSNLGSDDALDATVKIPEPPLENVTRRVLQQCGRRS